MTELENSKEDLWLGFSDPSSLSTNPGWPLRNLLALIAHQYKDRLAGLTILCWRDGMRDGQRRTGHSLIIKVNDVILPEEIYTETSPKCLGWEKNERGKLGARMVNLSNSMDPERLAESAVDLNLKLMKWRLLPELNLESIQSTKCLLLGAGTLGCYVARTLMVNIFLNSYRINNRLEFSFRLGVFDILHLSIMDEWLIPTRFANPFTNSTAV